MTQIAKEKINYNQREKDYKESLLTIRNISSTFDYQKSFFFKLTFERLTYRSHSFHLRSKTFCSEQNEVK